MKRYDYGGCDECSFGQLIESPEGDWMDADEVQARDLKLAELARALPHGKDCASNTSRFHRAAADATCNCPRGELLAMLRETTNG